MKKTPRLFIDRLLAGKPRKQILIIIGLFICLLALVTVVYTFKLDNNKKDFSFFKSFPKAFVDLTNPETLHKSVYEPDQNTELTNKLPPEWLLFLAYIFGAIVFTGLLIATITNAWRGRAERFRRGIVDYRFSEHIIILGYNGLVPGMIQRICEQKPLKDIRIVVGVEDHASTTCDKIKNRLYEDYRDLVVVLKADSCNRKDLKRLRVNYAHEVYIIGEHDDAYNLRCYRTIYELWLCERSKKAKMPKCYVNLHSQATLTLFRTYASADELGIDFSCFQSFSFYDEWARTMIMEHWDNNENLQDHFIIAGMTEMGIALARKIVLLCHKPSRVKPCIITLVDNDIADKSKLFIVQNQDFFDRCHYSIRTRKDTFKHEPEAKMDLLDVKFEFTEGDLSDEAIRQELSTIAMDPCKTKTLAICYDNPQHNIAMGLSLPKVFFHEERMINYKDVIDSKSEHYRNEVSPKTESGSFDVGDVFNKDATNKAFKNKEEENKARVWIYQPTLGDLGKYLKSDRYVRFETFGMSGDELDIQNEKCTETAMRINHFFLHKKDNDIDFSNSFLIKTEWEGTDIAKRWICIRHAEFIPILKKYEDTPSKMKDMERNRSTADIFLFGETDLYSLKNDFYSKYISVLEKISQE